MTPDTRNNHRFYDAETQAAVPKDAVVIYGKYQTPYWENVVRVLKENDLGRVAREIEAQTKPPRIPEPGLWGVVEANGGTLPRRRWVHHEEGRWVCDTGVWRYWDDLDDPQPVRDGIEESR